MKKTLMHKNVPVANFTLTKGGNLSGVTVLNEALFPAVNDTEVNALRRFLITRKTTTNRDDLAPIVGFYGAENFTTNSYRSMLDCYWIKDTDSNDKWENISAFRITDLDEDGVFLSLAKPKDFEEFTFDSPNLTLCGKSKVFWYKKDNVLGMINADSQADMQMKKIANANNIDIFKEREYLILSGNIYTFTKTETSEDIERIPFDQLYLSTEDPNKSRSENLKYCCMHYEIPGWKAFVQKIVAFNKIAPDKKIELLDIGVLRNTETLEYLGFDKI